MTYRFSEIQKRMASLTEAETPFVLATVIRTKNATSAKAGAKAIVEQDGAILGWLGGGCVQRGVREGAKTVLADGKPRLIRVEPEDEAGEQGNWSAADHYDNHCPSGGSVEIFLEAVLPRPQLVVCGGSPITRAVADLAHWLGYSVVVAALADDQEGFDHVDHRLDGFDLSDLPPAKERYVVVATQGKGDRKALTAALTIEADYHAFVGSREKGKALKARLAEEGTDPARLEALRNPAGLDIAGVGPQEIALSVLAEITLQRRRVRG